MNHSTVSKNFIVFSFGLLFACSNAPESGNKPSVNTNSNKATNTVPTTVSVSDAATKIKIEGSLKKAGFADITVDATTTPISIRGTVTRDKVAEVIFVAEQAAGKPLKNEITEKK